MTYRELIHELLNMKEIDKEVEFVLSVVDEKENVLSILTKNLEVIEDVIAVYGEYNDEE